MKKTVLMLYNRPDGILSQIGCVESEAGVLEEVEAVAAALKKLRLHYRIQSVGSVKEMVEVLSRAPETVVFNLVETLEGSAMKAAIVPSLCKAFEKACTGCNARSLTLTTDKWQSKAVLAAAGLPVPRAFQVEPGQTPRPDFPGPYIVKPVAADGSEGIDDAAIVKTQGTALNKAVRRVHTQFEQTAIVEQFVDGREFNITVLNKNGKTAVMPVAEINFAAFPSDKPRIIGYEAKWIAGSFEFNNTPRVVPAKISKSLAKQLTILAARAAAAVGCTDYCRVDFRVDKKNRPFILEVNANPDLCPQDGVAAAVRAAGIQYHQFVKIALDNALARAKKSKIQNPKSQIKNRKPAASGDIIRLTEPKDVRPTLKFLADTKFFRHEEIHVAEEVITDAIKHGPDGPYQSYVLERGGAVIGWVCWGPTPCTVGSFDIYWLGISPKCQGQGLGRKLMDFAEEKIRSTDGRLFVVETSGRDSYLPTRAFYERLGYTIAAIVKDFYAPGDDKIIYTKSARQNK
jgi:D-alanine-D-alanine ligase